MNISCFVAVNGSGQAFTAYLSNDIFLGAGQAVEFDRVSSIWVFILDKKFVLT